MEKKLENINLLPLKLIKEIFLRIPIKHLARLRIVSKLWNTLISDPDFAKSHLDHSLAPSHSCLFLQDKSHAYSVDLDSLLQDDRIFSISKKAPPVLHLLGSCRGFVLLHAEPQFFIQWNPLTGSGKTTSYPHMDNAATSNGRFFALLYGFGYDASQDDYVVVVAYKGKDGKIHFDLCCLGSNSWIILDAELPESVDLYDLKPYGLFCNGAIHWSTDGFFDGILTFDLKERNFSQIDKPIERDMFGPGIVLLGGCLGLYSYLYSEDRTEIWVMKEYKVQSSWTLLCEIPLKFFKALCLSANGDIIGRCHPSDNEIVFCIYNVSGVLLQNYHPYRYNVLPNSIQFVAYENSLMAVSSSIKDKKMKKESRANAAESEHMLSSENNSELNQKLALPRDAGCTSENVEPLEKQLKGYDLRLQQAVASVEANQEKQSMLCSTIKDMELVIEDLKSKVSKAEIRADSAEDECIIISETNAALNEELSFLRNRVECLEGSLHLAEEAKVAAAKDIRKQTMILQNSITQIGLERERLNKQLSSLASENKFLAVKLKQAANDNKTKVGDSLPDAGSVRRINAGVLGFKFLFKSFLVVLVSAVAFQFFKFLFNNVDHF